MRQELMSLFNDENYIRMNANEICTHLGKTSSKDFVEIVKTLNALEDEGIIYRTKKNKYDLIERFNFKVGPIDIKKKGFGFVRIGEDDRDVFIPRTSVNGALPNDIVMIKTNPSSRGGLVEGEVIKIVTRNTHFIIGDLKRYRGKYYVESDDKNLNLRVYIDKESLNGAFVDHKVKVLIDKYGESGEAYGSVIDVIGHKNDPGIDITSVALNYQFRTSFPEPVLAELAMIPDRVTELDIEGRKDLRARTIVTIDGADAKDLDDGVYVEKLSNGNYLLGVYIADVAHYVKENSKIEQEAYLRGTSVYLADRVIPMLPHQLSNGICSLNPGEDRLAMACEMEIDKSGTVVHYDIFEAVIHSHQRMTYEAVNKMLEENDPDTIKEYENLYPMFKDMQDLAKILYTMREKRGSLDFETSEARIVVDETGKVLDVVLRTRGIGEKLIEEFMLIANETVASAMSWLECPFIYRVHEEPNGEKLQKIIAIARALGYNIKGRENKIHSHALQQLLNDVKDEPAERALNTLLLRSMAKARYAPGNLGHYGLASKCYTHFTSPIRRYPDLLVHRLIKEFLFKGNLDFEYYLLKVNEASTQSSKKERDAIDCENEVNDMKKAEYMEQFIGEEFEGVISSISNWGMYVELPNTVEGLIHVSDMNDDYYNFDSDLMIMIGERTRKIYRIGDVVKVKLISASKAEREINFELVETKKKRVRKYENKRKNSVPKQKSTS